MVGRMCSVKDGCGDIVRLKVGRSGSEPLILGSQQVFSVRWYWWTYKKCLSGGIPRCFMDVVGSVCWPWRYHTGTSWVLRGVVLSCGSVFSLSGPLFGCSVVRIVALGHMARCEMLLRCLRSHIRT